MDTLTYSVFDRINLGVAVVDKQLKIVLWNQWLENLTGKKKEQAVGSQLVDICPRFKKEIYLDILEKALFYGQKRFCSGAIHKYFIFPSDFNGDKIFRRQNMYIEPITISDEQLILIQIFDITTQYNRIRQLKNLVKELESECQEAKMAEANIRKQAFHDALTGLYNRLLFNDRLFHCISYAQRNQQKLALLFIDLDGFKHVNDNLGHYVGDLLLQEVSNRLKLCLRKSDTLARVGGDEFTLILPEIKKNDDAASVAEKIIQALNQPYHLNGQSMIITASIGISIYPDNALESTNLIKKADNAMYLAKAAGKNNYRFFQE